MAHFPGAESEESSRAAIKNGADVAELVKLQFLRFVSQKCQRN
jgi:hypothetical protein